MKRLFYLFLMIVLTNFGDSEINSFCKELNHTNQTAFLARSSFLNVNNSTFNQATPNEQNSKLDFCLICEKEEDDEKFKRFCLLFHKLPAASLFGNIPIKNWFKSTFLFSPFSHSESGTPPTFLIIQVFRL
jgi:hypothetical protein